LGSSSPGRMTMDEHGHTRATATLAKAAAGDPEAQWSANLQHASINGTAAAREGLRRIPIEPANVRIMCNVPRSLDLVAPVLRDVLRELAFGRARWPLLLIGDVGVGKTRAALCLADMSRTAAYTTVDRLCDRVMASTPDGIKALWEKLGRNDLAILDEIGQRDKVTDLALCAIQRHLDVREACAGRVGIYITNVATDGLSELYGDRIMSRLLAGTVFTLDGPDRRAQHE